MSRNIEITRAAFGAWNRGDLDGWLSALDPDIEFYPAGVFPDFDHVYRGHDGLARFWRAIHDPWRELRADIEYLEERDDRLVVKVRFRAIGDGGIRVDLPLTTAIKIRDGLAVQMISRPTIEEAWAALGE